jgi:tRNA(Arg) A34 adenosine deaminase TadA
MNQKFMREAIRLSLSKMRANHGGPFGAIVIRKNKIVGRGWNKVTSANDPTAHAEVTAGRSAQLSSAKIKLSGAAGIRSRPQTTRRRTRKSRRFATRASG